MCAADDTIDGVVVVVGHPLGDRPVDLDEGDPTLTQATQPDVPGAEIVDADPDSRASQLTELTEGRSAP